MFAVVGTPVRNPAVASLVALTQLREEPPKSSELGEPGDASALVVREAETTQEEPPATEELMER